MPTFSEIGHVFSFTSGFDNITSENAAKAERAKTRQILDNIQLIAAIIVVTQ